MLFALDSTRRQNGRTEREKRKHQELTKMSTRLPQPPPPPHSFNSERARRIDVRRLPLSTTEIDLRRFMADLGIETACTIDFPRHRSHATMSFATTREAESAAKSLNGMVFRGRLLAVSSAFGMAAATTTTAGTTGITNVTTPANATPAGLPFAPSVNDMNIAFGKHITADTQEALWRYDLFPSCGNPEAKVVPKSQAGDSRKSMPSFMHSPAAAKRKVNFQSCASCGGALRPSDRGAAKLACSRHFHCGLCIKQLRSFNVRQHLWCCLPCHEASGGQTAVGWSSEKNGDWLQQAAEELHDQAALLFTTVVRYVTRTGCAWGENLPPHLKRRLDEAVVKLYEAERKRMTSPVEYLLARIFCQPGSPNKDLHRGMHYCTLASSAEHPAAMCMLGRIFATTDMVKACRWYSAAAHAGNREAQFLLGLALLGDWPGAAPGGWSYPSHGEFLRDGVPMPPDADRAVALLTLAAEPTDDGLVHAGAANALGLLSLEGIPHGEHRRPADRKAALRWFHIAAEGGNAEGQYHLGVFSCSSSAPSDPSGGWYRSPHGDRGWSPPSKNYPEPPTSERDPWANWTDVEIPRHDHSKVSTNGGADEGYGIIRSMKCFARAAAQGHVAAQLELDRWLPSVAKSLTGLEAGNRVFLGGFAAEDWEFLNGEAAVIEEISKDGATCSVRLLPATDTTKPYSSAPHEKFSARPENIRPLLC